MVVQNSSNYSSTTINRHRSGSAMNLLRKIIIELNVDIVLVNKQPRGSLNTIRRFLARTAFGAVAIASGSI